jgi:hypothetical protein
MERLQARFRDFIHAYWPNWFALMSGGPSVPAAIAAFWVQSDVAKIALWATVAFCFVLSAFFIWRAERLKVIEFTERLKPKFQVAFDAEPVGIVDGIERTTVLVGVSANGTAIERINNKRTKYLRLCINATDEVPINACEAYIVQLDKRRDGEPAFTHIELPQAIPIQNAPFDVKPRIASMVDFIKTTEDNRLLPVRYWPFALENVFAEPAVYCFAFKIHGDGVTADPIVVDVEWSGVWDAVHAYQVI